MGDAKILYRMMEEESLKYAKTIARLEEELADCQEAYHIQGRDKRILEAENRQLRRIIDVNAPDVDVDYNLDALKEGR